MNTSSNETAVQLADPNWGKTISLVVIGLTLAVAGIYVGETDDAPGAAVLGIVLMIVMFGFAVRSARRKR